MDNTADNISANGFENKGESQNVAKDEVDPRKYGNVVLSDDDAAKAFRKLADLYYKHNFGTVIKSEIDSIMFETFLSLPVETAEFEVEVDTNAPMDALGSKDESSSDEAEDKLVSILNSYDGKTDYSIGLQLGLSPTRVANLRLKYYMKNPPEGCKWFDYLNALVAKGMYKRESGYILFTVPEKGFRYAIEDALLRYGSFYDLTFNPRALKIPEESLLLLIYTTALEESISDATTRVKKTIDEGDVKKFLVQISDKEINNDAKKALNKLASNIADDCRKEKIETALGIAAVVARSLLAPPDPLKAALDIAGFIEAQGNGLSKLFDWFSKIKTVAEKKE